MSRRGQGRTHGLRHGWSLGRFLRNLADHGIPLAASAITQEHIYRYLGSFAHLSLETRHRYFREVRCFFNWLVETGHLEASPFAHVRNLRLPNKIVQPFTQDDVKQLLAACSDEPGPLFSATDGHGRLRPMRACIRMASSRCCAAWDARTGC